MHIFAFQVWYCELCLKKRMKGRQKALFTFLFFLAFSQWNLSWKFELTTFQLNNAQKLAIFIHFIIIFYSLSSHPPSARSLFLIVHHNGVKRYSREKGVVCDVVSEQIILWSCLLRAISVDDQNMTVIEWRHVGKWVSVRCESKWLGNCVYIELNPPATFEQNCVKWELDFLLYAAKETGGGQNKR